MNDRLPEASLRIGMPSGSMQQSTIELFGRAGYRVTLDSRSVFPRFDDDKIASVLFRSQEISRYVVDGIIDCGLCGHDWVVENGNENDVVEVCELTYSRATSQAARWVLCVPEESKVRKPEDLNGGIIATELVNVTKKYFANKGVNVTVEFSWGTTEIKARLLDAIVELTETGSSIRANNLRVLDTLLNSTIRFIANKKAWDVPWKRQKMENIAMLLKGAIEARAKVGLKMNVPEAKLAEIVKVLPAEKSPTVSRLDDKEWVAVEVILEEKQERELIPVLKRAGATGIITYPLNKVIPELMNKLPIVILVLMGVAGCAQQSHPTLRPTTRLAATRPDESPESYLPLDQIPPRPNLEELVAQVKPATEPSLDAIELYARARGALGDGQRFNAINLFERALQADPDSFDIRYDLAKAYSGVSTRNEQAIANYEAAAKLRPDDIDVQTELGRQYLASDRVDDALVHLRLAIQTSDYATDDDAAAMADYYLGRALQRKGYDRAAIDQYDSLLNRLQHPTFSIRGNPEMAYIAAHPEGLYLDLGRMYEKHGQYDLALRAYQFVEDRAPESFENHARVATTMVLAGQDDQAIQKAIGLVDQHRASSESLTLLKSIYRQIGREKDVVDELKKLQAKRPDDRTMLYALADTLYDFNRRNEAAALLTNALARDPKSLDLFRKLFNLYESRDDTIPAAKVWIAYLAEHPDALTELSPLWDKLTRISRKNSIHLTDLQKLDVPANEMGCKLFLVSRQAEAWNRDALARSTLEQATKQRPIFPPAFRAQTTEIWTHQDWDKARKIAECDTLIDAVKQSGDEALAAELRGLSLLNQDDANGAIDAFAQATKLGDPSPDLQLTYALALRKQGNEQRFEQLLWKLMSDRPGYEQAYSVLFNYYDGKQADAQKRKVVSLWRSADPTNLHARLLDAAMQLSSAVSRGTAQIDTIEAAILEIFHDYPDQPEAIAAMQSFYAQTGRMGEFMSRLENECAHDPANRTAVEYLVDVYASQKRTADAARVLDASRAAMGNDPDLLYSIAHLYERIDQPQTTEEILAKVIEIDPHHAAANNDLGYSWTDEGKNLDRAESMIRIAVDAEPDNESFLDSLGWVLYKRARFDEARVYFERAIAPATFPDPVVLDHLGDTLYRLNDAKLSKARWSEALTRISTLAEIGAMRDELVKLRLTLIGKIRQADQDKPVTVAPTAAQEEKREQAKN